MQNCLCPQALAYEQALNTTSKRLKFVHAERDDFGTAMVNMITADAGGFEGSAFIWEFGDSDGEDLVYRFAE